MQSYPTIGATAAGLKLLQAIREPSSKHVEAAFDSLRRAEYSSNSSDAANSADLMARLRKPTDVQGTPLAVFVAHYAPKPRNIFRLMYRMGLPLDVVHNGYQDAFWTLLKRPENDKYVRDAVDWLIRYDVANIGMRRRDGMTTLMHVLRGWPSQAETLLQSLTRRLDPHVLWAVDAAGNSALSDAAVLPRGGVILEFLLNWYQFASEKQPEDNRVALAHRQEFLRRTAVRALCYNPESKAVTRIVKLALDAGADFESIARLEPLPCWRNQDCVRSRAQLHGLLRGRHSRAFSDGDNRQAYRAVDPAAAFAAQQKIVEEWNQDAGLLARDAEDVIGHWDVALFRRWVSKKTDALVASTGATKRTVLAHAIAHQNMEAVETILELSDRDRLVGGAHIESYLRIFEARDASNKTPLMLAIDVNNVPLINHLLSAGAPPKYVRPLKAWEERLIRKQDKFEKVLQDAVAGAFGPDAKRRAQEDADAKRQARRAQGPDATTRLAAATDPVCEWQYDAVLYAIKQRRPGALRHVLVWDERRTRDAVTPLIYSQRDIKALQNPALLGSLESKAGGELNTILTDAASRRLDIEQGTARQKARPKTYIDGRGQPHYVASGKPTWTSPYARGAMRLFSWSKNTLMPRSSNSSLQRTRALTAWLFDRGVFYLDDKGKPCPLLTQNLTVKGMQDLGIGEQHAIGMKRKDVEALVARLTMSDQDVAEGLRARGHNDISALAADLEAQLQIFVGL